MTLRIIHRTNARFSCSSLSPPIMNVRATTLQNSATRHIEARRDTDLMSKPQDGFVSRFLNRPISRRITSVLLKFPIHPSTWTISICVLPLIASVFLVRGDYVSIVIGAAIFQVFSILDGCDGEIARAKNL